MVAGPPKPPADDEPKKKASALAAATIAAGSVSPGVMGALGAYVGGRVAASRIVHPPADLSELAGKPLPRDLPGVIDKLLAKGTRNKGIVFGDTNHDDDGIGQALADPRALAAMKRNGVTHIFVELPPQDLRRLESEATSSRGGSVDYDLIRNAKTAGITLVAIDRRGLAAEAYTKAMQEAARTGKVDFEKLEKLIQAFGIERQRVNSHWVAEIQKTMATSPGGRFVMLAGDDHMNNAPVLHGADIALPGFNELVSKAFDAPVPYIRMRQTDLPSPRITLAPAPERSFDRTNPPDLLVQVPPLHVQRVDLSVFKDKPAAVKAEAISRMSSYHRLQGTLMADYSTKLIERRIAPTADDAGFAESLDYAGRLALEGKASEARESLRKAEAMYRRRFGRDAAHGSAELNGMKAVLRDLAELHTTGHIKPKEAEAMQAPQALDTSSSPARFASGEEVGAKPTPRAMDNGPVLASGSPFDQSSTPITAPASIPQAGPRGGGVRRR